MQVRLLPRGSGGGEGDWDAPSQAALPGVYAASAALVAGLAQVYSPKFLCILV